MIPKFRAWDKDSEVMRSWEDLILEKADGDDFWLIGYRESRNIVSYDRDQILMQYTGLKDKNGIEIYEGDVVRGFQNMTTSPTTPYEIRGVATYSSRYTMFYLEEGKSAHDNFTSSLGGSIYTLEVIGNVYENPELLV